NGQESGEGQSDCSSDECVCLVCHELSPAGWMREPSLRARCRAICSKPHIGGVTGVTKRNAPATSERRCGAQPMGYVPPSGKCAATVARSLSARTGLVI